MRIAIYYNIAFSGAKRVVMEQVRGLIALGHHVDIYTTDVAKDIFDPAIHANNKYLYNFSPRQIRIPMLERIKSDFIDTFYSLKKVHKQIAEDIDKRGYDIALIHIDIYTQAPFVLRYLKTKKTYFCLEPLRNAYEYSLRLRGNFGIANRVYEAINRYIRKQIDKKNTLSSDNILAISLFGRERIIAAYDLYPKISYLGIDEKVFKPMEIKKKNQILFVAEKRSIYGYDFMLNALKLVPKDIRPKLKIVSWNKDNLQRLSDEQLVKIYNESLMTLSLSTYDTFGLVPLESMACETPAIALNVAGYRETIKDKETGFLVDFDPQEIAEKIIFLLSNPAKASEMGKRGRIWIEDQWTWEKAIKDLENNLYLFNKK